jgi:hypothetical protein
MKMRIILGIIMASEFTHGVIASVIDKAPKNTKFNCNLP